ncbi:hypothetical protein [Virgisporangium aurantiacum]|uniref:Lipoprotein n=1 Tax=Virgisporangium aurantiacum TaxID=175570 RepID=A0A8J4E1B2_9ACTN|nr:hypothetical protein [Virgisporangium aurantiacum]GIJ57671.1 hypothetical protein Vau01_051870 [Virgisporangium aurantiacum]
MLARTGLVLFASVALAVGLAGCGNDKPKRSGSGAPNASASASASGSAPAGVDPSASGGSGAPGAPGDPGVAGDGGTATGSDKQVCADQEKLVADSTRRFGEAVVQAASGEGGEQAAVNAVKTLFSEWAAGMRTQAGKATSPELKQALTEYAQGLEKVNSQINGVQDLDKLGDLNTAEIESATDKVLRICG